MLSLIYYTPYSSTFPHKLLFYRIFASKMCKLEHSNFPSIIYYYIYYCTYHSIRTIFRSYMDKNVYKRIKKFNPLHQANWMDGFTINWRLKLGDLPCISNCGSWLVSDLLVRLNSSFFLPGPGDKFSLVFEQV